MVSRFLIFRLGRFPPALDTHFLVPVATFLEEDRTQRALRENDGVENQTYSMPDTSQWLSSLQFWYSPTSPLNHIATLHFFGHTSHILYLCESIYSLPSFIYVAFSLGKELKKDAEKSLMWFLWYNSICIIAKCLILRKFSLCRWSIKSVFWVGFV